MKKEDFRIIYKSDAIINGPYAYTRDLPDDLKAAIAKAFIDAPTKDKAAFDKLSDGQKKGFHPADHQGLGRHDRADQVRRQPAQEEGVLIDRRSEPEPGPRDPAFFVRLSTRRIAGNDRRRIAILPEPAARPLLNDAYRKAVARKRLRMTLSRCGVLSRRWSSPASARRSTCERFFTNIGNFASYFDRIFTLDSGARVWTDVAEWFWGWQNWLTLLGETLLIAYVGTLARRDLALRACFFAAANTSPAPLAALRRPPLAGILPHRARTSCSR